MCSYIGSASIYNSNIDRKTSYNGTAGVWLTDCHDKTLLTGAVVLWIHIVLLMQSGLMKPPSWAFV